MRKSFDSDNSDLVRVDNDFVGHFRAVGCASGHSCSACSSGVVGCCLRDRSDQGSGSNGSSSGHRLSWLGVADEAGAEFLAA